MLLKKESLILIDWVDWNLTFSRQMTFLKFDSKCERTFIEIVMYLTVCIFWTYFYLWYNFIPVMSLFMCYQMNRMFTRWWSLNHQQAFFLYRCCWDRTVCQHGRVRHIWTNGWHSEHPIKDLIGNTHAPVTKHVISFHHSMVFLFALHIHKKKIMCLLILAVFITWLGTSLV